MTDDSKKIDEAARWAALLASGRVSDADRRAFSEWKAEDDANRRAAAEIEMALGALDGAGADLLAEEFERELRAEENRIAKNPRRGPSRRTIGVGASTCLLAGALALALWTSPPSPQIYKTAVGQTQAVALQDGSTVILNTNSTVEIRLGRSARDVKLLQGEAMFEVASADRPFKVRTAHAEVRVVGTVFNVRADDLLTTVQVLHGRVAVAPGAGPAAALGAGESVRVDGDGASDVAPYDARAALAWREGKLRFAQAPIGEVVRELNRYSTTPIRLAAGVGAELPVTAEFDVGDQRTAAVALATAFSLSTREAPDAIYLEPEARD